MNIENILQFHNELISIGLSISGCDSSGNVQISSRPTCPEGEELTWVDPTDTLIELCLAAHEQPLSSTEALALQAELSEAEWLAYTEVRKQPIRNARAARYKEECDVLYLKLIEDATVANTTPDLSTWVAAKNAVRADLPYESE